MSIPEASGSLAEMADKPFFEPLYDLFQTYGGIFKLSFGPQSFVIVSDPNLIRNILVTSADQFSKGILSDILEFVMGNGLIPSNGEIWVQRRRAILPSLHKSFIENMIHTFVECTERGLQSLEASIQSNTSIEMESFFSRLALDIIGRAVFNYDFDATTHDDPVIKVSFLTIDCTIQTFLGRLSCFERGRISKLTTHALVEASSRRCCDSATARSQSSVENHQ